MVSLLGPPRAEHGGKPANPPKGRKAWGLLAYLLLSRGPHSRGALAGLLFANADDPLGALRWNLAQLRKTLALPKSLRGSQLDPPTAPHAVFDVHVLLKGSWSEAVRLPTLGRDLLQGMDFASEPGFETWLMLERERVRSITRDVLCEAAAASLGRARPERAADLASRAVLIDPFSESAHEVLIRALAAAGLRGKAEEAERRCTKLFQEELGCEPGPAIREALREARPSVRTVRGAAAARAQLDLGRSAIKAGAIDTGIESLRIAVEAAQESTEAALLPEALLALAYALVHSVRGRDGEASTLLHRALELAERNDLPAIAAECGRELGYVQMLVGSYDRALTYLERAVEVDSPDPCGRAWAFAYEAICYSDTGRYKEAVDCLNRCLDAGDEPGMGNPKAYALCLLGRIQMLRGALSDARATLQRSIALATDCGWTVLLPWPLAMLAEVDLLNGAPPAEVRGRLQHAFSLAQQIGDPCWEGAALHGLGLVEAASGSMDAAAEYLQQASTICVRYPDSYLWMRAYVLDALCDIATKQAGLDHEEWVNDLQSLAARTGMNEFLARSYLYRGRGGDSSATSTARLLAGQVDNPALSSLI